MIYTVTMNPALDYILFVDKLEEGRINRSTYEEVSYGGKGINVSVVLNELGAQTKMLGFTAGFTGLEIERLAAATGISSDFIRLKKGASRINVKIADGSSETAVNASGPEITLQDLTVLFEKLDKLQEGDVLVLAGSLPPSLPADTYEQILKRLEGRRVKAVVDAEKDLLMNTLKYQPFLIKPNHIELGEIFNREMNDSSTVRHYAEELRKLGARNVLVSRGEDGALLVSETNEVFETGVVKGNVVNTVGAGDSMIAGFLAGYLRKKDYGFALAMGTAAGAATAFSKGIAGREEIYHVFDRMILW